MANYKHSQLKNKGFEEISMLFDNTMKWVDSFVPMDTEVVEGSKSQEKLNGDEAEMKKLMEIVPDDEVSINAIPLATKSPIIIDWKIIKEGKMGYFQIIRVDGSSRRYSSMIRMLQNINREDLETLWKLVKAKHRNTRPEETYERVLWGDLKVMFEHDVESEVWINLQEDNNFRTEGVLHNMMLDDEGFEVNIRDLFVSPEPSIQRTWVERKLQTAEDLQGDALLHYDAEMELMNLILLSIPNDIYNSVDACTSAKDMWKRVERLMRGTIQNKVDRETRFTNEFDQFVAEPGEALVSVYNRFAQLMNDLERNDMHFPIVTINTKFLNSLQPEWLKYVTQVRLAKRLTVDTFDDLFDYLQQFEKLVNVSRAKKLETSYDPLALVAHTGSSSKNTSSYYVTHPTSVVDYEDEYQQDDVHTNSEDPLASAMLLLARAITQNFSTPTNNRLRTSSNTRNQAIIQGDRVNIQSRNSGNAGRNNKRAYVQEEIVEGSNAPNETEDVQRTLCTSSSGNTSTDEARVILTDEQNDFLFADASRMEEIEELSANICLMAKIQPADNTSDAGPSYDYAFISEVL
ncbi:hypothetical protein Tco_0955042 [Tanacetum coccineum]|uniref:Uncharacterized protein n=1 Tax=Tanacetum coccineum TaxID=301880 RepID=A0ABQ5E640_9ASTR